MNTEGFSLIFDKVAIDYDSRNTKAANLNSRYPDGKEYVQGKHAEGYHRTEGMWADDNNQGKENIKKCKGESRRYNWVKSKKDTKGDGNGFTASFFFEKRKCMTENRGNKNRNK